MYVNLVSSLSNQSLFEIIVSTEWVSVKNPKKRRLDDETCDDGKTKQKITLSSNIKAPLRPSQYTVCSAGMVMALRFQPLCYSACSLNCTTFPLHFLHLSSSSIRVGLKAMQAMQLHRATKKFRASKLQKSVVINYDF